MGNECGTLSPKIVPRRRSPSEESYRYDRPLPLLPPPVPRPLVRFSDKNHYHSDSRFADSRFVFSAENLERRARNLMMQHIIVKPSVETPHDRDFIEQLTQELIKAKAAIDECLYYEMPPLPQDADTFSIVPYRHIDQ